MAEKIAELESQEDKKQGPAEDLVNFGLEGNIIQMNLFSHDMFINNAKLYDGRSPFTFRRSSHHTQHSDYLSSASPLSKSSH
jgi:hypothetical protein